jgi:hypothetical protein
MERLETLFRALADRLDDTKDAPGDLRDEGRRTLRRLRGEGEGAAPALDLAAQRAWLDEALAAGFVTLDGTRYPVRCEARWQEQGDGYRVVLALFDERVLLSYIDGVVPADRVEALAACFDAVRDELHTVQGHVCDLRGVRGVGARAHSRGAAGVPADEDPLAAPHGAPHAARARRRGADLRPDLPLCGRGLDRR